MSVEWLKELLESIDGRLARVEDKVDDLQSTGCRQGAENRARLDALAKNNAAAGATAGAITTGVIGGLIAVAKLLGLSVGSGQ